MGCGCGKTFSSRSADSRQVATSRSIVPPQVQTGMYASANRVVRSQETPYRLGGKAKTVVRRSV